MTGVAALSRPTLQSELFTARGRTNRGRFWLTQLVLWVSLLAFILLCALIKPAVDLLPAVASHTVIPILAVIVGVVFAVVWTVAGILATIRRLHDRDKSGHWIWLFYGLPVFLNGIAEALQQGGGPGAALLFFVPSAVLSIWGFVEIGCLRGSIGANRFGPDPLQAVMPT
jgi:uncharacterized membrane protein YhaH (DUF805 family)